MRSPVDRSTAMHVHDLAPDLGTPATCGSFGVLHTGPQRVIAVFPLLQGLLVVRSFSVLLLRRDGRVLKTWPSERQIFSAAFDGTYLVIGDSSAVQVRDAQLARLRDIPVPANRLCGALVLVSGSRVVCNTLGFGVFYTFSLQSGQLLASSDNGYSTMYTAEFGVATRRVATSDFFVSAPEMGYFDLHRVEQTHEVVHYGLSGWKTTGMYATKTWAFDANAVHLINEKGARLRLCGRTGVPADILTCFTVDGFLGKLASKERFLMMADDSQGHVFGLVSTTRFEYLPLFTATTLDCTLQKLDATKNVLVAAKQVQLSVVRNDPPNYSSNYTALMLYDPYCQRVVMGYQSAKTVYTVRSEGF